MLAIPELRDDQIVPIDPEIAFVPNEDLEPFLLEPMIPFFDKVTQKAPRNSTFEEDFDPVCVSNVSVQYVCKTYPFKLTESMFKLSFNRFIGVKS